MNLLREDLTGEFDAIRKKAFECSGGPTDYHAMSRLRDYYLGEFRKGMFTATSTVRLLAEVHAAFTGHSNPLL